MDSGEKREKAEVMVMRACIISTGDELLLGFSRNTTGPYLVQRLAALGIRVTALVTVGDKKEDLAAALRGAWSRHEVIIITGGLGPTADDITVETVAAELGLPLELDEASLVAIEQFFAHRGQPMPAANRKQAYLPRGAKAIPNPIGTAPGVLLEKDGRILFLFPGPPRELVPMFEQWGEPYLKEKIAAPGPVIKSRFLRVFGLGEAAIQERIADLFARQDVRIAFNATKEDIVLRLTAEGDREEKVEAVLAEVEEEIRRRLGLHVFGSDDETLPRVVASLLQERGFTLALAESCTGGMIGRRITSVPGISRYFLYGFVTYSNEAKEKFLGVKKETLERYGAVSAETAAEMAAGARRAGGADCALAVTGIAGPGGGTPEKPVGLVYIGLAVPEGVFVRRFLFAGDREGIRSLSASAALNMLRRYLIEGADSPAIGARMM